MSELSLRQMKKEWHGSLMAYVLGFIACLVLTTVSFLLVVTKTISGVSLIYTLTVLALLQAFFQLLFFLHLGQEAKPKWESLTFCLMFIILLIIAIGTLWIMSDLNERVMPEMTEMKHD